MKIQISFTYDGVKYRYTIDEDNIDYGHYDDVWDWWFGENNNEIADRHYVDKDDEHEIIFEVTADKKFIDGIEIISGDGIYINVYKNNYVDDYLAQIDTDDIEVLYT